MGTLTEEGEVGVHMVRDSVGRYLPSRVSADQTTTEFTISCMMSSSIATFKLVSFCTAKFHLVTREKEKEKALVIPELFVVQRGIISSLDFLTYCINLVPLALPPL